MTLQELLTRIIWQAQRGGEKFEIAEQDATAMAEAMFPTITSAVVTMLAGDPSKRALLRRTLTITMNDGEGTIPDNALVEYAKDSTFIDPTDPRKKYALKETLGEFISASSSLIGYFHVHELTVMQREPGAAYEPGVGFSDDMELSIPCDIVKPAAIDAEVDVPSEVNSMLIDTGAEMLRGAISTKAVMAA